MNFIGPIFDSMGRGIFSLFHFTQLEIPRFLPTDGKRAIPKNIRKTGVMVFDYSSRFLFLFFSDFPSFTMSYQLRAAPVSWLTSSGKSFPLLHGMSLVSDCSLCLLH
jgi:hypothetical protein